MTCKAGAVSCKYNTTHLLSFPMFGSQLRYIIYIENMFQKRLLFIVEAGSRMKKLSPNYRRTGQFVCVPVTEGTEIIRFRKCHK